MFALRIALIGLILGALIHADWHFARPGHLGMNLSYHWFVTGLLFGVVGWFIARRWPGDRLRTAVLTLLTGVLLGQLIEPMSEALLYEHRFGYVGSPARWLAFWQALCAGIVLYAVGLWLGRQRSVDRSG
jgi:hypothetical protein